jgi:hypothetical protein
MQADLDCVPGMKMVSFEKPCVVTCFGDIFPLKKFSGLGLAVTVFAAESEGCDVGFFVCHNILAVFIEVPPRLLLINQRY